MTDKAYKFSDWIGRQQTSEDRLSAAKARRWLATFDREAPHGGALPQGIHWCLCTPEAATSQLGEDGHPLRDVSPSSFLPPLTLPRRMWAGSKVEFLAPIIPGSTIRRLSTLEALTEKSGSSGRLVFITVKHETSSGNRPAVLERQTLVFRDAAATDAPLVPPPLGDSSFDSSQWQVTRTVIPDQALLFRYSALTFNSHRIHYDAPYAHDVERYRGLVVHGPLTATLLLDHAAQQFGSNALSQFEFRGTSPAIVGEELILAMRGTDDSIEMGAFAADGREVMQAKAAL